MKSKLILQAMAVIVLLASSLSMIVSYSNDNLNGVVLHGFITLNLIAAMFFLNSFDK